MSSSAQHHDHDHGPKHAHDLGLSHDLPRIVERQRRLGRRGLLGLVGALGAAATLTACGADGADGSTPAATSGADAGRPSGAPGGPPPEGGMPGGSDVEVAEGEIPEETAGPYPGDGSNGVNVLTESGIVRSDLTRSFGDASGVAEGVPTTIRLRVRDLQGEDASPLMGAAVYLWHCDRNGDYSLYSDAVKDENYLRGVQETDEQGWVEFTSIFPAAYAGRWPHVHFEVYPSLAEATSAENKLRTSQLAIPEATCLEVYEQAEGYEQSLTNVAQTPLASDNVFSDGWSLQMAKATGSVEDGYTLTLNVPV